MNQINGNHNTMVLLLVLLSIAIIFGIGGLTLFGWILN